VCCATAGITSRLTAGRRPRSPKSSWCTRPKSSATPTAWPHASCSSGGSPDFNPASLTERSHADYDESTELDAMIRANLVAERVAVESYRQMIELIGDKDATTRRLLEDILADEELHADELSDWLSK
jgi:hypothetical protein